MNGTFSSSLPEVKTVLICDFIELIYLESRNFWWHNYANTHFKGSCISLMLLLIMIYPFFNAQNSSQCSSTTWQIKFSICTVLTEKQLMKVGICNCHSLESLEIVILHSQRKFGLLDSELTLILVNTDSFLPWLSQFTKGAKRAVIFFFFFSCEAVNL